MRHASLRAVLCLALVIAVGGVLAAPRVVAGPAPGGPDYFPDQWNLRVTQTVQAWGLTQGSPDLVVGVIDSGIDAKHVEFADKIVKGRNTASDSDSVEDTDGHGTFVSGVATALGQSMLGVAPLARVMPLKVQQRGGVAYADDFGLQPVEKAIRHGLENGVRIFNVSVGSTVSAPDTRKMVEQAWARGALIFAAAGNNGRNWTAGEPVPYYPAAYPQVIAVNATSSRDGAASYAISGPHIRLSAPGGDRASTSGSGAGPRSDLIVGPRPGVSNYDWQSGTSFAAPHAAGAAALVWSVNPNLTNEQVARILFETADRPGNFSGRNETYGYGRLNVFRAVLAALPEGFGVAIDSPRHRATVQGEVEIAGWAGDIRADGERALESLQVYSGDDPATRQRLGEATLGQPSPDVAAVLKNPALAGLGYRFRWDAASAAPGSATITVVARAVDGTTASRTITVVVAPRP